MLPRYDAGSIIHNVLGRTITLEKLVDGILVGPLITQNLEVTNSLKLNFAGANQLLFTQTDKTVSNVNISDIVFGTSHQATVTDNGNGTISVGTVQDIDTVSSPTFSNETITSNLKVGGNIQVVPSLYTTPSTYKFEMMGSSINETLLNIRKSDNTSTGPSILLQKSRNTLLSPTSVQNNDMLGTLYFSGYDGTQWDTPGIITSIASENHSDTSHGTRLEFHTTQSGTLNTTKKLIIENDGVSTFTSTVDSSSISSGALIVKGGVGISSNTYIGQDMYVSGNSNVTGTLEVTGSARIGGGLQVTGSGSCSTLTATAGTDSSGLGFGVLVANGGASIQRKLFVGGNLIVGNLTPTELYTLNATTTASAGNMLKMQASGNSVGFYVGSNGSLDILTSANPTQTVNISNSALTVNYTTNASGTTEGALLVSGGAVINKDLNVTGIVTKGGGSFVIDHPDPEKKNWKLRHCFVETNTRGDNIYRYNVTTTNKTANITLPSYFKYLNENPQVWVAGLTVSNHGCGIVDETLSYVSIQVNNDGNYNVLVIATRKDKMMKDYWDQCGEEIPNL